MWLHAVVIFESKKVEFWSGPICKKIWKHHNNSMSSLILKKSNINCKLEKLLRKLKY